jgi:hypothetical protein
MHILYFEFVLFEPHEICIIVAASRQNWTSMLMLSMVDKDKTHKTIIKQITYMIHAGTGLILIHKFST